MYLDSVVVAFAIFVKSLPILDGLCYIYYEVTFDNLIAG